MANHSTFSAIMNINHQKNMLYKLFEDRVKEDAVTPLRDKVRNRAKRTKALEKASNISPDASLKPFAKRQRVVRALRLPAPFGPTDLPAVG